MLEKVLCIEDDRTMQNIYKRVFNEVDFAEEIISVYNGEEALQYYINLLKSDEKNGPSNYPELIFLDLNMPVMEGWEFLDKFEMYFWEELPHSKVIILTSSVDPQEKERAKKHSIVIDFLSKPLTFEDIEALKKRWN